MGFAQQQSVSLVMRRQPIDYRKEVSYFRHRSGVGKRRRAAGTEKSKMREGECNGNGDFNCD